MGQYDVRVGVKGMGGKQRTTSCRERISKDRTWLGCGSGDRDSGNGTLTVEVLLRHCT